VNTQHECLSIELPLLRILSDAN